jgi:hypothetical protein
VVYIARRHFTSLQLIHSGYATYIRRMEESSLCKKLTSHLEGCRKKGRPKLRWLGDVLQDLKTLNVTAWWKKAQDRDSWKAVIKEAKAHKGL